jgi:hypothetical protein
MNESRKPFPLRKDIFTEIFTARAERDKKGMGNPCTWLHVSNAIHKPLIE